MQYKSIKLTQSKTDGIQSNYSFNFFFFFFKVCQVAENVFLFVLIFDNFVQPGGPADEIASSDGIQTPYKIAPSDWIKTSDQIATPDRVQTSYQVSASDAVQVTFIVRSLDLINLEQCVNQVVNAHVQIFLLQFLK